MTTAAWKTVARITNVIVVVAFLASFLTRFAPPTMWYLIIGPLLAFTLYANHRADKDRE